MDKDQLVKRLMATFLEELEEHVAALNRDLLSLEKDPAADQAERLKTLFRTAHSLKGAARSVNVDLIERACHQLEELLADARDGRAPLGPAQFALLFETADALEEAGMRLREQHDLAGAPLAALLPRLEAAAVTPAPPPEWREAPPEAVAPDGEEPAPPPRPETPPPAEPAAARPPAAEPVAEPAAGPATVRVPAEKLDRLLAQSGELLVARRRIQARADELKALREFVGLWRRDWRAVEKALGKLARENGRAERSGPSGQGVASPARTVPRRVAQLLDRAGGDLRQLDRDLERLATGLAGDSRLLKQVAGALDDEVRRVRMLPFAEACQGLDRSVRDLARAGGKEVDFVLEGGDVELDRSVLEGLKDPLRHLVRNAADHGIEPPAERRAAGKPPRGRVRVAAVLRGAVVEVVVADDGRGLDLEALRCQARQRGIPEPADERELARLVFVAGLSTSKLITDVSGRGVGLDVVKSRLEALHGTVDLAFTPGAGTSFTLAVPLTLTTLRALFVGAGGQTFALAGTNVRKLVRVDPAAFRSVQGRDALALGGAPLPVASLAETLGLGAREPLRPGGKAAVLVVAAGEQRMAFVVDEFLAEQEIMIKGLGARIRRVAHVSGATILPSGKIALVLNAASLIRTALAAAPGGAPAPLVAPAAPQARKRVLLAEDSLTTRTLMKSILEAAGYDVTAVADGAAAWDVLQERGADLLVSDVEMPRTDGFALAEAVRGSERFGRLPVVLVTARASDADRARGVAVGADAYLVKSAFDQKKLLETIAQLL